MRAMIENDFVYGVIGAQPRRNTLAHHGASLLVHHHSNGFPERQRSKEIGCSVSEMPSENDDLDRHGEDTSAIRIAQRTGQQFVEQGLGHFQIRMMKAFKRIVAD